MTSSPRKSAPRSWPGFVGEETAQPRWPWSHSSEEITSQDGGGIFRCGSGPNIVPVAKQTSMLWWSGQILFSKTCIWPCLWTGVSGIFVLCTPRCRQATRISGRKNWSGMQLGTGPWTGRFGGRDGAFLESGNMSCQMNQRWCRGSAGDFGGCISRKMSQFDRVVVSGILADS